MVVGMQLPITTTTEHLRDCPVCGQAIKATVRIQPELSSPTIENGYVKFKASGEMLEYSVSHKCRGRDLPEPEPTS